MSIGARRGYVKRLSTTSGRTVTRKPEAAPGTAIYETVHDERGLPVDTKDHGPEPYVVNIEDITKENDKFRVAKWTGDHMQLTLMSIPVGGEIGLEKHDGIDQFLRIEAGDAKVMMGREKDNLDQTFDAADDFIVMVPSGWWHNILNVGETPMKVYSLYAPPEHEHGTVHETFEESEAAHHDH